MVYKMSQALYNTYMRPLGKKPALFRSERELIAYLNGLLGSQRTAVTLKGKTNIASMSCGVTKIRVV